MKYTPSDHASVKIARVYLRVSTDEQGLTRQTEIERSARAAGYYIAGVHCEKASGARADRPELLRPAARRSGRREKIDRISRLPLAEAEQLVASIRTRGAKLAVPGLVDLFRLRGGNRWSGEDRPRIGTGTAPKARSADGPRRL